MANALIGSHPSHGYAVVEQLDSTKQLTRSDSGKLFMCDQGASLVYISLPKMSTEIAGWNAKFMLRTLSTAKFIVQAHGAFLDSDGDSVVGTGDIDDSDKMRYLEIGANPTASLEVDSFQFDDDANTTGAWAEVMTDGANWYTIAYARQDPDVDPNG